MFAKLPATWFALSVVVSGCGAWPRFANRPSTLGVEGIEPPETILIGQVVDEPDDGDWTDIPADLVGTEALAITSLWSASVLRGRLARGAEPAFGGEGGVGPPFGCAASEIPGNYTGDIDFFLLDHGGGPLCLVLDAEPGVTPAETEWDAVVYAFDGACIAGDFLTLPSADPAVPGSMVPGGKGFVAQAPAGEYAVYLAGVRGSYPAGSPVDYALNVVPVPAWQSCDAIEIGDFEEIQ